MSTALIRITVTTVMALAVCITGASAASAHSNELESSPGEGARLAEAPATVVITFDEPLMDVGAALVVRDGAGRVVSGAASVDGRRISTPLSHAGSGEFTVAFRVVSQDGHSVSGSYGFAVLGSPGSATPSATIDAGSSAATSAPPAPTVASPQADAPQSDAPQTGGGTVILWVVAAVVVGTAVVVAVAVALRR